MAVRCNRVVRLLFSVMLVVSGVWCRDCIMKTPCSCAFDDGSGTVDLTSLGHTNNTPAFKDVYCNNDGYLYSYNPCGGFSEGECADAAVCVLNSDKTESQQIGDAAKSSFTIAKYGEHVQAAYISGSGVLKLTTVTLICDPYSCTPNLTAQGQVQSAQFELTLYSICACPGMCSASGASICSSASTGSSLSGSSILLILWLCVTVWFILEKSSAP